MTNEEIRVQIEDEITKTKKLIEEYEELSKPVAPDVAIGRISRMDAINNKSITESALRQAKHKLKLLSNALDKVGKSNFGKCVKCQKQIPLGRILIKPESPFCVNCAT